MKTQINFDNMFFDGIEKEDLIKNRVKIRQVFDTVIRDMGKGWQEWGELPYTDKNIIEEIAVYGKQIADTTESFVVLGIGGSALGTIAVTNALNHFHHNELERDKRSAPKLYIEDNIDPERMKALLDVTDPNTTHFNVITKSGSTSETLSQFMIIYDKLKSALGDDCKNHITVTTTIGKGALYNAAVALGLKIFGIPEGVGGRFSVLSNVGLVPFAVMGYDLNALLKGAANMYHVCKASEIEDNPALEAAYLMTEYYKRGKNISVIMPYSDKLKYFADFYCQLWGESLAKAVDNNGKTINCGQTPVKALGVTDQHSQVQLYTEGPYDKVFTFIGVDDFDTDVTIPSCAALKDYDFLSGHTLGELLNVERKATQSAVKNSGKPSFSIQLNKINEESLGELIAFFMFETAFAGAFLNINTYNQPGVEFGKKATFAMLNRPGYEDISDVLSNKKIKN